MVKTGSISKRRKSRYSLWEIKEMLIKGILFIAAIFAVMIVFFIILFLLMDGHVIYQDYGTWELLSGDEWKPWKEPPLYGTWPLIVGTILVTLGAMVFAIPLSLGAAIYISQLASPKAKAIIKPAIELLAGIPSVVYGFFGLLVLSDWLRVTFDKPSGTSWLAGSIILGIMALPTIISVAEDAISAVPRDYKEGSLAMGATRWQTISKVIVPASLSGVTAAIILGMGRVFGETMAVMMVCGNAPIIPEPLSDVFSPIRTMTATLGIEMGEVAIGSEWFHALFGLAVLLMLITLTMNLAATYVLAKLKEKHMASSKKKRPLIPPEKMDRMRPYMKWVLGIFLLLVFYFFAGLMVTGIVVIALMAIYFGRNRISRKWNQRIAFSMITLCLIIVLVFLGIILFYIIYNGLPAISWEFLTESPSDNGRAGGIFPAIVGTIYLVVGAIIVALPIGVGAAIYLTEYTKEGKVTKTLRAGIDLLNGTPSIVFGLFAMAFLVIYLDFGISMIVGQLTLGFMVLPTIIRTTEEALRAVPQGLREGSYALGATKWQTIRRVVLPPATPGIVTGTILSIGRAAGETAPIMFTAVVFSQRYLPNSLDDPVMALPFHLFYLSTAIPNAQQNSAGTALVLLILVLIFYMVAIIIRIRASKGPGKRKSLLNLLRKIPKKKIESSNENNKSTKNEKETPNNNKNSTKKKNGGGFQ
jgi:phosphate transport system permease protein